MRLLLTLTLLLSLSVLCFAQKTDTITITRKFIDNKVILFSEQAQLYIDSSGKSPVQQIDRQTFFPLHTFRFQPFAFDYFDYVFWLRVTINNPADVMIPALFTAGVHKGVKIFRKVNGRFVVLESTQQDLLPHQRPFRYDEKYVPLKFYPHQTYELLIKISEHPQLFMNLQPKLVSYGWEYDDKMRAFFDEYRYLMADGFFASILFFVAMYMFVLYFVEHKRYYIYYAGYLFFILLFALWGIEHSPYMRIFFSFIPFLKFSANNNTYALIANIFYYLFLNEFLELGKIAPKFEKTVRIYLRLLILLLIADTLLNFIFQAYQAGGYVWIITQPVIAFFGIYSTIMVLTLKGSFVKYIKWGSVALLSGVIVGISEQLLMMKPFENVLMRLALSMPFNIGVLVEILCFSTALGYKTWLRQRNRNLLMKSVKESDLRTLRSQINPHFIFNSLNAIKSYILNHRSVEAAEYLTDFSTLMRSILQNSKEKLIPLADELETTLLYIKLEKLRFDNDFEFVYEIDNKIDTSETLIPPMLLQPYIENAIKHGLMNKPSDRRLTISIRALTYKTLIVIDDNGIGREQASLLRKHLFKNQSMGMNINDERIKLLAMTNDWHIDIQIIDKKASGKALGTKVMIYLPDID
ncbi:histidine kinase [Emticicia sp. BO119]|uniref:histidine kinase n=1 Tax=Emticicia sp. BO119 TaxID=2757768 RepID=UPI0015F06691|nr:histidine kinase [Emticicia sp. BO119]MBA4851437.1 histidine kinase [Emticicia sp. BO119]